MPVVSVVLAGLMMQSRGAIRLGMRIACRRTPTAIGFGGYSGLMQTKPSLPEPGFIFHTYQLRVHMNPANPIDSAVVHPPRMLVALWCCRRRRRRQEHANKVTYDSS